MPRSPRALLLLYALLLPAVLPAEPPSAPKPATAFTPTPAVPFVSNNGFEIWAATPNDDWPVDWGRAKGLSWMTEGGRSFMRLAQQAPGDLVNLYREFSVPSDVKAFHFESIVRATNVIAGEKAWYDARIILQFTDANRAKVKGSPAPIIIARKSGTDWKKFTRSFAVPAGATRIECMVALFKTQSGTLDVDLFTLEPISLEQLAAASAPASPPGATDAPAKP